MFFRMVGIYPPFAGPQLYYKSITIPNSVTYIGDAIFEGCDSLQTIYVPQGMTDAFCQMGLRAYRNQLVEVE